MVQKDLLETCLRKRLYPDEIKSIAKSIIGQYGGNNTEKMIMKEEQRLMKFRLRLKQEQISTMKNDWTKMTRKTMKSAQLSSDGEQRMRMIVKTELGLQWKSSKSKMKAKIEKFNSQKPSKEQVPEDYLGILIKDRDLIEKYGDNPTLICDSSAPCS